MKTQPTPRPGSHRTSPGSWTRIAAFVALIALIGIPLFSSSLASSSGDLSTSGAVPVKKEVVNKSTTTPLNRVFSEYLGLGTNRAPLFFSPALAESIATFAADCTTPKSTFIVGETVCAVTTGVTLPTNRFVNWIFLASPPVVVHGGGGVTDITVNPQSFTFAPATTGSYKVSIAEPGDISQTPASFTVIEPPLISTYAHPGCTVPKSVFALGETVCAKTNGVNPAFNRRFAWVDPAGLTRSTTQITTDPQTDLFTLPTTDTELIDIFVVDNRGTWKANVVSSRGSLVATAPFQVVGAVATADLSLAKSVIGGNPDEFTNFKFELAVTNFGPSNATNVVISDATPANTTFVSSRQLAGPLFSCDGTNILVCTRTSLLVGQTAVFEITYTAGAAGNTIANVATGSSDTTDLNQEDNTASSGGITILGVGGTTPDCVLECPTDITVARSTSTPGPGALVTFPSADPFGSCGTLSTDHASGSFFPVGTTIVTASSSTGGGTCTFAVTVIDAADPTVTCPPDQTVAALGSAIEASVSVGTASGTGTDVVVTGRRDDDRPLSDPYQVGTTEITWTTRDSFGREASCTQTITVTSADAPTITCPSNKTFTTADCAFTATAAQIGTPTATGIGVTVTSRRSDDLPLTDPFPAGVTAITWTATDDIGRTVSCTQAITVNSTGDSTAPTLNVPGPVSTTTSSCSALLDDELGVATAEDPCGSVSISRTGVPTVACPIPGNPGRTCETFVFPTGTTIITYTATDASGNSTTGTQTVTVTESPAVPPTISLIGVNPQFVECHTSYTELGATATDNCSGTFAATPSGSVNVNVPGNYTITYNASDASGNPATPITRTVTVQDTTKPVITRNGPSSETVECHTSYTDAGATASDTCDADVPVTTSGSVDVNTVGIYTITYNATDDSGNAADAVTRTVTVVDTTKPVITRNGASPVTVECHTSYTDAGATASDTCDANVPVTTSGSVDVNTVGTYTITYNATDDSGNAADTVTRTVNVVDTIAPTITLNSYAPSMWPPNHKYQTFQLTAFVTGATDSCQTGLGLGDVVIEKVTSDETENGNGDGNTVNDIVIAANCKSVQLRSEREGGANGRVYTITFKVADASGNVGRATARVVVPHNNGSTAVDSGVHYTVTCP